MPKSASSGERAPEDVPSKRPPARSRKRRVQQLASYAEDLLEERLRHGTASPTEVVAAIRLASEYETASVERIRANTELMKAQKAKAEAEAVNESMFQDAITAIKVYKGRESS